MFSILKKYSLLIIPILIVISGCQKKETPKENMQDTTKQVQPKDTTAALKKDSVQVVKYVVPDLKGKWNGTFDKRATTLSITEQNGMEFKGNITINYREVINQQVSGKIDTSANKVTMKDLLHSRFAGSYSAKLGKENKNLSGTFTMNVGGQKLSFNLSKK